MAIEIQLDLKLAESTLTSITQRLTSAVQNVSAILPSVELPGDFGKDVSSRIQKAVKNIRIDNIPVSEEAVNAAASIIQNKLNAIKIGSVTLTQNALKEVEKQLFEANLKLSIGQEKRAKQGARESGVSRKEKEAQDGENRTDTEIVAGLTEIRRQLTIELDKETNFVARNSAATQQEFQKSRKNIDDINKARESLRSATDEDASALKRASKAVAKFEESQLFAAEAAILRTKETKTESGGRVTTVSPGPQALTPRSDLVPLPGGGSLGDLMRGQEESALNELKAELAIRTARRADLQKQKDAASEAAVLEKENNDQARQANAEIKKIASVNQQIIDAKEAALRRDISPEKALKDISKLDKGQPINQSEALKSSELKALADSRRSEVDLATQVLTELQQTLKSEKFKSDQIAAGAVLEQKINDEKLKELQKIASINAILEKQQREGTSQDKASQSVRNVRDAPSESPLLASTGEGQEFLKKIAIARKERADIALESLAASKRIAESDNKAAAEAQANTDIQSKIQTLTARVEAGVLKAKNALEQAVTARIPLENILTETTRAALAGSEKSLEKRAQKDAEEAALRAEALSAQRKAAQQEEAERKKQAELNKKQAAIRIEINRLFEDLKSGIKKQADAEKDIKRIERKVQDTGAQITTTPGKVATEGAQGLVDAAKRELEETRRSGDLAAQQAAARKKLLDIQNATLGIQAKLNAKLLTGEAATRELAAQRLAGGASLGKAENLLIAAVEKQAAIANQAEKDAIVTASLTKVQQGLVDKTTTIQAALRAVSELRLKYESEISTATFALLSDIRRGLKSQIKTAGIQEQEEAQRKKTLANIKLLGKNVETAAKAQEKSDDEEVKKVLAERLGILKSQGATLLAQVNTQKEILGITSTQLAASESLVSKTKEFAKTIKPEEFSNISIGLGKVGDVIESAKGSIKEFFKEITGNGIANRTSEKLKGVNRAISDSEAETVRFKNRITQITTALQGVNPNALAGEQGAILLHNAEQELLKSVQNTTSLKKEGGRLQGIINKLLGKEAESTKLARENATRNRKSTADGPSGGRAGGATSLVISNAGDVQNFAGKLNVNQLGNFANAVNGISTNISGADSNVNKFVKSFNLSFVPALHLGGTEIGRLNRFLQEGSGHAFEFGKSSAFAAKRFLAFAVPAKLIASTIGKLKSAVGEIVDLDKQARRLIFFQTAGQAVNTTGFVDTKGLGEGAKALDAAANSARRARNATTDFAASTKGISAQISSITKTAQEYGLEVSQVTDALITIARVGQDTSTKIGSLGAALGETNSEFAKAALGLVRLENGAIGAAEAVRGLQAIQSQFFGGKGGAIFEQVGDALARQELSAIAAANAMAFITVVSAQSTATSAELIDATTRVGAAFRNIQGLNFQQTVAIIGEAFTVTGATTGRIATALRQTATLISQNAAEIQKLTAQTGTGIEIIKDGQLRDFEAVLDVLQRIKESAGTVEATELSLLIGDRRNLADIEALAANVDSLREKYSAFANLQERLNAVTATSNATFEQTKSLSASLSASIERLNATFTELVNSEGVRGVLTSIASTFQSAASSAVSLSKFVGNNTTAFAGLSSVIKGIIFAKLITGAIGFLRGLKDAFSIAKSSNEEFQKTSELLSKEKTVAEGLAKLERDGLITTQARVQAQRNITSAIIQRESLLAEQARLELEMKSIVGTGNQEQQRRNQILERQLALLREIKDAGAGITRNSSDAANGAAKNLAAQQTKNAKASGALVAAGAVGGLISGALAGKGGIAGGIGDAINTGLQAGAIGFAVGGPLVGAATAFFGFLTGGIIAAISGGGTEKLQKITEELAATNKTGTTSAVLNKITDTSAKLKGTKLDSKAKEKITEARRLLAIDKETLLVSLQAVAAGKELDDDFKRSVDAAKARAAESQVTIANEIKANKERARGKSILEGAAKIRAENAKLEKLLLRGDRTANELAEARTKLQRNEERLKGEAFADAKEVAAAEAKANRQLELRIKNQEKINQLSDAKKSTLDLARELAKVVGNTKIVFTLDREQLDSQIETINETIRNLVATNPGGAKGTDDTRKAVAKEEKKIRELQVKAFSKVIGQQRTLLADASNAARQQISAWKSAAESVTKAFESAVADQRKLSSLYADVGKANASIISSSSSAAIDGLNEAGASAFSRLAAIAASSTERLSGASATSGNQASTLGKRFQSVGDVGSSVDALLIRIGQVIKTSDQKVTDSRLGIVRAELAQSRVNLQSERSLFKSRLGETRRELDIRKNLLNTEIKIIQERLSAERRINEERARQSEEFGKLLLESPVKFKETVENINTASGFFKGITDVNIDSLKTIAGRVSRARKGGDEDSLKKVFQGITDSAKFGKKQIIAGVDNKQLEKIFGRIQTEDIGTISDDLRKAEALAKENTKLQQEIKDRQIKLVQLADTDVLIQKELVRLSSSEAKLAVTQRDIQAKKIGGVITSVDTMREQLVIGIQTAIALLAGDKAPAEVARLSGEFGKQILNLAGTFSSAFRSGILSENNKGAVIATEKLAREIADAEDARRAEKAAAKAADKKIAITLEKQRRKFDDVTGSLEKFKIGLEAATPKTSKVTDSPGSTIGSLAEKLRGQFDKGKFLPRNQIKEVRDRASVAGGQLTREEKSRISQLERRFGTRGLSANNERGGRDVARKLFRDKETGKGIVNDFRQTTDTRFTTDARRLRGSGDSGKRNIDVDAVKKFLEGRGLSGAAKGINTKGQAAKVLDQFIGLGERLAKEQNKISTETKEKIIEVLGRELTQGVRESFTKEDEAKIRADKRREKEQEELANIRIAQAKDRAEKDAKAFKEAITKSLSEGGNFFNAFTVAIKDGNKKIGAEVGSAIGTALTNSPPIKVEPIKVDDVKIVTEIAIRATDALNTQELGDVFRELIAPLVADSQILNATAESLAALVQEMTRRGMINPAVRTDKNSGRFPGGRTPK